MPHTIRPAMLAAPMMQGIPCDKQLAPKLPLGFLIPILIAVALNPLNSSMLATAIAPIERDFPDTPSVGVWLVAALYLASAIAQPVLGRIADVLGPRRVLIVGMVLVGVGAIMGYVASTVTLLLASRVILGVGTAAGYPTALAIIQITSSERGVDPSARTLAALSIAANVSVALGPILGGLLVAWFGWRATFLINVPFAALTGILILSMVRPDGRRASLGALLAKVDLIGIALFGAAMGALLVFLMQAKVRMNFPAFAAFVILTGALIWFERRKSQPFLDVRMLSKNGPLLRVYARQMLVFLGCYMMFYSLPQWMQDYRRFSPGIAGLLLLPMPLVSSAISWKLAGRSSSFQYLVGAGALLLCGPLVLMLHGSLSPLLLVPLVAIGLGVATGATTQGNQQGLVEFGPAGAMGTVAGMFRTAQYCGAMLSACISAWVFVGRADDISLDGAGIVLFPVAAMLLLLAFIDMRAPRTQN